MAAVIPRENFRITKGDPRKFERRTGPSSIMECWFCADCGTCPYHMPGGTSYPNRNLKPGTLDDSSWLEPAIHFWTRSAQPWVVFPPGAECCETQPETLGWKAPAP